MLDQQPPAPPPPARKLPHPVQFEVDYPERLSRLLIFVKLLLAIPHFIAVYLLGIAVFVLTVLAWFAILFTGRYPKAFFEFTSGYLRWTANLFAYIGLLRDEYPPFSWEPGQYPAALTLERAERQSRFRLFIRAFAIIPNYIVLYFVQLAWLFTTFIAWWAILFTSRYPRGLFKFSVGVIRWYQRQYAYLYLLRDEYPPYSTGASARPGNEVVSAIIGAPFLAAYMALYALLFAASASRGDTRSVSSAALENLAVAQPRVSGGGLQITLKDYEQVRACPSEGGYCTAFRVDVEKTGWLPLLYTPYFFSVTDCRRNEYEGRNSYTADPGTGTPNVRVFWGKGSEDDQVLVFDVPPGFQLCELSYYTFGGEIRFVFRSY